VVALWDKGQAEPRYLTTDLTLPARAIVRLYGKRFQIEETFRDQKSSRLGFALSEITTHSAERLESYCSSWHLRIYSPSLSVPSLGSADWTMASGPTPSAYSPHTVILPSDCITSGAYPGLFGN
jgi:hypothetical protein